MKALPRPGFGSGWLADGHPDEQAARERLPQLGFEPTAKRVRAVSGETMVADSRRCLLVWEPKRVVPSYAVPEVDVRATVVPTAATQADERIVQEYAGGPPVLTPSTPFAAHTAEGQPVSLETGGGVLRGAGFRAADPDLEGYVVLHFAAFDTWLEYDEPILGHPRDPFSRIDIRRSASPVQVQVDGGDAGTLPGWWPSSTRRWT